MDASGRDHVSQEARSLLQWTRYMLDRGYMQQSDAARANEIAKRHSLHIAEGFERDDTEGMKERLWRETYEAASLKRLAQREYIESGQARSSGSFAVAPPPAHLHSQTEFADDPDIATVRERAEGYRKALIRQSERTIASAAKRLRNGRNGI